MATRALRPWRESTTAFSRAPDVAERAGRADRSQGGAVPAAHQTQIGFMNQRGGVQRVIDSFARHSRRGEFAQFVINERQELRSGLRIARLDGVQDARDVGHDDSIGNQSTPGVCDANVKE